MFQSNTLTHGSLYRSLWHWVHLQNWPATRPHNISRSTSVFQSPVLLRSIWLPHTHHTLAAQLHLCTHDSWYMSRPYWNYNIMAVQTFWIIISLMSNAWTCEHSTILFFVIKLLTRRTAHNNCAVPAMPRFNMWPGFDPRSLLRAFICRHSTNSIEASTSKQQLLWVNIRLLACHNGRLPVVVLQQLLFMSVANYDYIQTDRTRLARPVTAIHTAWLSIWCRHERR